MKNSKSVFRWPNRSEENGLYLQGYKYIAGIDEVGRGALAGPVVAAAVILPQFADTFNLREVRDSKEILPSKRDFLFALIEKEAESIGIGVVTPEIIDSINILNATKIAMYRAVEHLTCKPDYLLIDGLTIPSISIFQKRIVKGDKLCLSISCASIVAKVTRDRMMIELDKCYPNYGLANHKGYGTRYHLSCLNQQGPLPIHRYTFAPVRQILKTI